MERCALITGCSSGIGHATALAFLEEEWDVYATARNPADITELAEAGCRTAALDVTDDEQVMAVVSQVIDERGRLDCLVNNAGFCQSGPVEDVPTDRVHRQFEVNVYGPHRLTREALPHMRARGDGTVVNVSSGLGRISLPGSGVYAGSKFALEAMSDALRAEVADQGIDVVTIEPGLVNTQFTARLRHELNDLERTAAYENLYRLYDDWSRVDNGGFATTTPQVVADAIVNAASATKPQPRYQVGPSSVLAGIASHLPAGARQRVFRLGLKLSRWLG